MAGLPSAVLAAKRAANRGADLILATTDRPVDDHLATVAEAHGLAVFRGATEDVRARFLAASADMDGADVIVRLTADNMVPDGAFVATLVAALRERGVDYLGTSSPTDGLPYGLSAEAMRVGALRASAERRSEPGDLEHVTPSLREMSEDGLFDDLASEVDGGHLRCTLDDFYDFQLVTRLFDAVENPIEIGWKDLVGRLAQLEDAPPRLSAGPGLVLGTAQLGAPYGSVRKTAPPSRTEAMALVRRAIACNAGIDTARAYPGAEEIIGRTLAGGFAGRAHVTTKLAPLEEIAPESPAGAAADAGEVSALRSVHALGHSCRPALLLHRARHLTDWGGAVWRRLEELQAYGTIGELGISVQSVDEAETALATPSVRRLQLPLNPLDRRWRTGNLAERIRESGVAVQFRSVFLQGILIRDADAWPRIDGVDPASILERLAEASIHLNRSNVADLCIAAVRGAAAAFGQKSALVIGAERLAQFNEILAYFERPALTPDEAAWLDKQLPSVPDRLVNPALWPAT